MTNQWQTDDLRLFIDGHLQFSERDEYRYHEALVHPVFAYGSAPKNVLVLGGGDGLAIREILRHETVDTIDLVDLDPEMTKLGTTYAPLVRLNQKSMSSDKVTVYNQDAFIFIQQSDKIYDHIIIDFPDPHNEALSKLYSTEFYAMVHRRLSDDGAIVSQSSSPFFANKTYWTIGRTIDEIFPHRVSFNVTVPSFGLWGFHIAHKKPQGALGPMPSNLLTMSPETFQAAQLFPNDIAPPPGIKPNSIFDPVLYHAYASDLKNKPKIIEPSGS